MAGRDIVVVGASAGGVEALRTLLSGLPPDLPASVFIVIHRSAAVSPLILVDHLGTDLSRVRGRVKIAEHGEPILRDRVYFAPAERNMLLERGWIRVEKSPKEYFHRPAINPLFRSAALAYGPRVVGVTLTGNLDDGTAGLWEIKRRGGVAIVQDPEEAEFKSMPQSALANVAVDFCLRLAEIGPLLGKIITATEPPPPASGRREASILIVEDERSVALNLHKRLEEFGYRVCASVGTGEEAIAAAGSTHPDLVLMDIRLPGKLDGAEAARAIWQTYHVPTISISPPTRTTRPSTR
jgi:chemotaxis response regulator CheB